MASNAYIVSMCHKMELTKFVNRILLKHYWKQDSKVAVARAAGSYFSAETSKSSDTSKTKTCNTRQRFRALADSFIQG